ncbi:hypothetical protein RB195_016263 [Necator americanus]|uniref:Uncharacterized protein n=1 Tax=Necator americanus TaxID=51031 RepID=A0ABR1E8B1_NECAM
MGEFLPAFPHVLPHLMRSRTDCVCRRDYQRQEEGALPPSPPPPLLLIPVAIRIAYTMKFAQFLSSPPSSRLNSENSPQGYLMRRDDANHDDDEDEDEDGTA